jgi:murein DD-endopeptidase MepM/ murein hydrolase activator NlpD
LVAGLLTIPGYGATDLDGTLPAPVVPPFLATAEAQTRATQMLVSASTVPSVPEAPPELIQHALFWSSPAASDAMTVPVTSTEAFIVVQAGQTLWAIAEEHKVTVEALQAANDVTRAPLLAIGQRLVIPGRAEAAVPPSTSSVPPVPAVMALHPGHPISRIVGDGETLWDIAQAYGVSVDAIVEANALPNDNLIFPGERLVIPIHTVGVAGGVIPRPRRPSISLANVFMWPARGRVTSGFGFRRHPVFGTQEMHTGIDIGAPLGTPVVSARAGTVIAADWEGGYGKLVRVDHGDGLTTSYSHLSQIAVHVGQQLYPGDLIGYVGNTGFSTGPHLLFEIRVHGRPLDPLKYL